MYCLLINVSFFFFHKSLDVIDKKVSQQKKIKFIVQLDLDSPEVINKLINKKYIWSIHVNKHSFLNTRNILRATDSYRGLFRNIFHILH